MLSLSRPPNQCFASKLGDLTIPDGALLLPLTSPSTLQVRGRNILSTLEPQATPTLTFAKSLIKYIAVFYIGILAIALALILYVSAIKIAMHSYHITRSAILVFKAAPTLPHNSKRDTGFQSSTNTPHFPHRHRKYPHRAKRRHEDISLNCLMPSKSSPQT
jgi:hypothetical protein